MTDLAAFARGPALDDTRFYMGNLMSFLLRGEETGGRWAITDASARLGSEPPPHVHLWEDEVWYILDGEAEMFVEGQADSFVAGAGAAVFLPRGKAHAAYFRSAAFRTLLMVQAVDERPVGMDTFFWEASAPATSMSLPENATTYAADDPGDLERLAKLSLRNGVQLLTPEETKARLPNYPGFGANRTG